MFQKNLSTSRALYGDCYPMLREGGGREDRTMDLHGYLLNR
jgi:hypothetical protein